MSVKTKYYFGFPGSFTITDSELSNVTIQQVTRSGMTFTVSTSLVAYNLRVFHDVSAGKVTWATAFYGPPFPARPSIKDLEKISVKFKY